MITGVGFDDKNYYFDIEGYPDTESVSQGTSESDTTNSRIYDMTSNAVNTLKHAGLLYAARIISLLSYSVLSGRMASDPSPFQVSVQSIAAENIFPEALRNILHQSVGVPLSSLNRTFHKLLPVDIGNLKIGLIMASAATEEVLFRGVIQRGLLYYLPQSLIDRWCPDKKALLDSQTAKATRIALAALIYALSHTEQWSPEAMGTVPQFIGGLLNGWIIEQQGMEGMIPCILAHAIFNMINIYNEGAQ